MKESFLRMIDREINCARLGVPAHIIVKINSLEDPIMCRAIVKAAQEGVVIDLLVRGICCLRPSAALPNLKVISVVGRFLEHSRIFYFRNGVGDPIDGEFYIGSADWMFRNLNRRVEIITPVIGRPEREKCWELLQVMIHDRRQAWALEPSGRYVQHQPSNESEGVGSQSLLMKLARDRVRALLGGVVDAGGLGLGHGADVIHEVADSGFISEPINDDEPS